MGKKRRLNKFISKWIKSDLPVEERPSVLLLAVHRIPPSPQSQRRPFCPFTAVSAKKQPAASFGGGRVVRRTSSARRRALAECRRNQVPTVCVNSPEETTPAEPCTKDVDKTTYDLATSSIECVTKSIANVAAMERSVESIGTCSLDVEASADLSDWSEVSSAGTLRSASILTPAPEPHLPSYLSLACTVNGYSTTTNYDPIRLSRSRDVSPHRIDSDLTANKQSYSIQNNLLSPPNLVPLPTRSNLTLDNMDNTLTEHHHGEFYSSKTMTFLSSKESRFTSNLFIKDNTDGCVENGHHIIQSKCVSFESKNITSFNGQSKCTSETAMKQEFSNGKETKSFIQQRVERLYGPGALAQGFFVTKRQKNGLSESEDKTAAIDSDRHSKSMSDKIIEDDDEIEPTMKQSTSTPTLPVLRHLRPEFRAQLPIISPKRGSTEGSMLKSVTLPKLKDDIKINGHSNVIDKNITSNLNGASNGYAETGVKDVVVKDGHYFIRILEDQAKRLLELAANVESLISTPNLSEEIKGKLRSASGKARLLVSQKMQQFRGLCTNNINQSVGEAFPTTNEDLQGFWDMVMLQVDQVDALFKEIDVLHSNNWEEVIVSIEKKPSNTNGSLKTRKTPVNRLNKPSSVASEEARKQRETQRKKMIEERRKAMKAQQQSKPSESIEIFVPESS